jgi:hypothetical protein
MKNTPQKLLIEEALNRFRELEIPIERSVIVEKWHRPTVISGDEFIGYESITYMDMCWYNSSGQLHSFNDMPSKISFHSRVWINVEWHKNGEPYRKNYKFNKLTRERHFLSDNYDLQFHWLNKKGELHSVNDQPALISIFSVRWYRNNLECRRYFNNLSEQLPCAILKGGDMTFLKNKDDTPEHVKYPFSTKYYGEAAKIGLNQYEKYVQWPIRELLTL